MSLFFNWQVGNLNLYSLNFGMIIMLHKTQDADVIQKYRPICLLHVFYKFLTKVTTLRVEAVMGKLIFSCHITFIKGRNIIGGVM
jgi:hypothetical protein